MNSTLTGTLPPLPRPSAPLSGERSAWIAIADTDTGEVWGGGDHTKIKVRKKGGGKIARGKESDIGIKKKNKKKRSRKTSFANFSTPSSKHLPSRSEKTPCHHAKSTKTQTDRREPPGNKKNMYTIQKEHSKRMREKGKIEVRREML